MLRPDFLERLAAQRRRYAVTGASGWLGRNALDLLRDMLGPARFAVDVTGYAATARAIELGDGSCVEVRPLGALVDDPRPDVILHFAFVMREHIAALGADAYTARNAAIADAVDTAIRRHRPAGLFLASSGAARGTDRCGTALYGALKRADEARFGSLMRAVGGRCVIARIFGLTGRHAPVAGYALGSLVHQARTAAEIVIQAPGPVRRSYVAARDLVGLALAALADGEEAALTFDATGEPVELGVLAEMVRCAAGRPALPIRRPAMHAPADDYVGDPTAFGALARRYDVALDDLATQVRQSVAGYG